MHTETLDIDGKNIIFNIYHENRNSARCSIGKNAVIIRLPSALSEREKYKWVLKYKIWAIKKIKEMPQNTILNRCKIYKDADVLEIGDEKFYLSISSAEKVSSSARLIEDKIIIILSSNLSDNWKNKVTSTLLSRVIAKKRMPKLVQRINELNKTHFNKPINKIFFKNTSSRWGSCSKAGNINISTRLLFAPDDVLTYVCLHELAHLIEPNHSKNYWELVENAMPDYKKHINWLKENGHKCMF
ncbi:MAG: M48 family metallopeptidase [archaeon]